ncbi:MAG: hypothetical protein ACE14L_00155 [Terriglobales bacterium]
MSVTMPEVLNAATSPSSIAPKVQQEPVSMHAVGTSLAHEAV